MDTTFPRIKPQSPLQRGSQKFPSHSARSTPMEAAAVVPDPEVVEVDLAQEKKQKPEQSM